MFFMVLETPEEKRLFEAVYDNYFQMMYNIAYNILREEHLAEDAVGNAFEQLIRHKEMITELDSMRTKRYLAETVKNAAIDLYRRRKRRAEISWELVENQAELHYQCTQGESPEILEAIRNLPDKYREVILLKYSSGYQDREIAEILHITESNVRKRIQRAKQMLREGGA